MPSENKSDEAIVFEFLSTWAINELKQGRSFTPLGISMELDGKFSPVASAASNASEELSLITKRLRQRAAAGEIRAAAVVADVRVCPPGSEEKVDAIRIVVETSGGYAGHSYQVYYPEPDGRIRVEEPIVQKEKPLIFVTTSQSAAKRRPWWKIWMGR
jgi:hypothetical protein